MLKKRTVAAIVDVISKDPECMRVINKHDMPRLLKYAPHWLGATGAIRNATIQAHEWWNGVPPASSEDSGSQYFLERICQGVANSVQAAFSTGVTYKKKDLPGVDIGAGLVKERNMTFFGHYANLLVTSDRREYILDWWMTLEIDNPMVWQRHEWNHYPIIHRGIPFKMFDAFP